MSVSLMALALAAARSAPTTAAPASTPPCSSAEYRALDFWVGEWELTFTQANGSKGHATNRITKDEFGSCVISEHFEQADIGYVGASHSSYDPSRHKWVQTWVDNQGAYITLVGGPMEGQPYKFELVTTEPRGPSRAYSRMIWEKVTPDSLTWRWQQRQPDGNYRDSWVIDYRRRK